MSFHVCIVQPVMKGYRIPFFLGLADRLQRDGVTLEVAYGTPWVEEAKRGDNVDLPPPLGKRVESRYIGGKLLWIPVVRPLIRADCIIVEHANKNVINYPLALANSLKLKRVGYWGHGLDRQADPDTLGERYKRHSLHWADWWFAYTAGAARYVESQGFDARRVTVVRNSIDTRELREQVASISDAERAEMLSELSLPHEGRRLLYCGSLYENKRLDLMLPAVDAVHKQSPDVQLIVIGGGPQAGEVERFSASRPWVRYVGPQFGRRKAVLLSLADVWLNPGLVGLGVLDAFGAGLPMVTTNLHGHGPEVEYLEHGVNGLMVAPEVDALSDALNELLQSPARLSLLQKGALDSAQKYSVETMVENFAQGVLQWLKS